MGENYHGVSVRSETTMTDDLKAPERIWAWQEFAQGFPQGAGGWITHQTGGRTEYVRADRIATLEAALADMTQQRDAFRRNLRETFDAMCAMRDSINDYLPMQSLESDLLQGPENSIFCATVAEAVVSALTVARHERDAAMAGAVKVKPLMWHEGDEPDEWKSGPYDVWCELGMFQLYHWSIIVGEPHRTADNAKAAAQADYNARILSALTPDPDRMLALTAAAEAQAEARGMRKVVEALPHRVEKLGGQSYAYVRIEEILAFANAHDKKMETVWVPEPLTRHLTLIESTP